MKIKMLLIAAALTVMAGRAYALELDRETLWSLKARFAGETVPLPQNKGIFQGTIRDTAYDDKFFDSVHKLETSGGWCTAFLIAPSWALTAAHCVTGGNPEALWIDRQGRFTKAIGIKNVFKTKNYAKGTPIYHEDFALLQLASPAPKDLPFAALAAPEEIKAGVPAMTVGYPDYTYGGKRRIKGVGCSIRSMAGDSLYTDCPLSLGNSGGPLFVQTSSGWKAAGVVSTHAILPTGQMIIDGPYTTETANLATNLSLYLQRIQAVMNGQGQPPAP